MLDLYADESCQDGHRFLVIGCLIVATETARSMAQALAAVRERHGMFGEIKWTKVSRAKLQAYKDITDVLLEFALQGDSQFHWLIVDTSKFDHHNFNHGDAEIGFNKCIYQLLHKAALRNRLRGPFYGYLDNRTTRHGLDELQGALNGALRRDCDLTTTKFSRLVFRDSKDTDLLQITDLFCGAVGFHKNEKHQRDGASPAKCELAEYIRTRARLRSLVQNTPFSANRFRIWNLQLQERQKGAHGPRRFTPAMQGRPLP
jgi:hypothetical protein